jgi:hypothetical protein
MALVDASAFVGDIGGQRVAGVPRGYRDRPGPVREGAVESRDAPTESISAMPDRLARTVKFPSSSTWAAPDRSSSGLLHHLVRSGRS